MARIPQAQRQIFNTTIVGPVAQPGVTNIGAISAAAAGGEAIARVADTLRQVLVRQRQRELVAQGAEFSSQLNLQFHDQFKAITAREDVQRNPALARDEIDSFGDSILSSESFRNQPSEIQNFGRRQIASLKQKFGIQARNFEHDQSFKNTVTALNNTQNNFEVQALTTDTDIDDLANRFTAAITASVKSGALTLNKGEEVIRKGVRSITLNRANRLINSGDLNGAELFISNPDVQENLGAKNINALQKAILKQRATIGQNNLKDFQNDPAKLAIRNGAIPDNPQSILDNQFLETVDRDGNTLKIPVPKEQAAVLTNEQASFIAFNLNNAANVDILDAELQNLERTYGSNFPIAINNLKKNGLSDNLVSYAMMGPEDRLQKETLLLLSKGGAKEAEGIRRAAASILRRDTAISGIAVQTSDISNRVAENLSEYMGILANEGFPPNVANNFLKTSELMAFQFVLQGRSLDDAARLSTEWLLNNYDIGDVNNGKFRVPIEHNINDVETVADIILRSIKPADITRPDVLSGIEGLTFDELKDTARWELNADQSGLILVDQFGRPVRDAGGVEPLQINFADVPAILEQTAEQREVERLTLRRVVVDVQQTLGGT